MDNKQVQAYATAFAAQDTKGKEGGKCNVTHCQAEGAIWYNHGSLAWYCPQCRNVIENDSFNKRDWDKNWRPRLGHPMFETRQMIAVREAATAVASAFGVSDRTPIEKAIRDLMQPPAKVCIDIESFSTLDREPFLATTVHMVSYFSEDGEPQVWDGTGDIPEDLRQQLARASEK